MTRYAIIGNGVAGATAAEQIRSLDPQGAITMFSEEDQAFYYRPRLPEIIAGTAQVEQITLHGADWYQDNNIDLKLGASVAGVDLAKGELATAAGDTTGFDKLLVATGAHPFIPPVQGSDKPGVFALRTVADAMAIREAAQGAKAAVLVGGGLLGLEAGHGLTKLGLTVKVVEFFDRLLPRQMDVDGAAMLQARLEEMGFEFHLGARAQEVLGDDKAAGLRLEGGVDLEGGLVLFSAGIRGNVELAQAMGLEIDKGIKVDDRMRTSVEGVWAAGDQIEHRGRLYGIWPASRDQGKVAGMDMAGGEAAYEGTVMSNQLKVVGIDLTSAGEVDAEGSHQAAVWQGQGTYRKIVLQEGRIIGLIFLGVTQGVKEATQAMDQKRQVGHLRKEMESPDFDFSRLLD